MTEHRSLFINLKKNECHHGSFLPRLLSKPSSHNQYHHPVASVSFNAPINVEPSPLLTPIVPPPPPPPSLLNNNHTEHTTG